MAALGATAVARGISLRTELATDLPVTEADPVRLRSVLRNLVANAIRHTPPGGTVEVVASADPEALRDLVRDTGEGFPADLLSRVFERFVKDPSSPGSGLGLAIARDLVAAHGGTILARNEVAGAVVEFTLPLGGRVET